MSHSRSRFLPLCLLVLWCGPADAAQVTGITARYSSGQTFLTWTTPADSGWTYDIYRSTTPPGPGDGPSRYEHLGTIGDSSWCDRRLSSLQGRTVPYVIPVRGALAPGSGLFVHTCGTSAAASYAVTCRSASVPADTTLVLGVNATGTTILEWADRPRPVRQRTVTVYYGSTGVTGDVYTLWAGDVETPFAPAMCNRPSTPYDCAVSLNAGGPTHALMFHAHVRGGNFLTLNYGSGTPGEYVITMDDNVDTPDVNTFWFGYPDRYDLEGANGVPTEGTIEDFTLRRVIHTLEWARREFPVDTSRVYVMGASMGGMAGVFLALRRPDLIAATMVNVPLFDFSFEDDPNTGAAFGRDGAQRIYCDHLFGTVQSGLKTGDGTRVFDLLNGNQLVKARAGRFVPPIIAFSGRYDTTIGWAEKPRFYATMREQRAGGCFFFDTRSHLTSSTAEWIPLQDYRYVYRFRTDRSFPAFSRCSADGDPGDGRAESGDSVGTINGFMDWDDSIVDSPSVWAVNLKLRDLSGLHEFHPAPDSLEVDVTPRRAQAFHPPPYSPVQYSVVRSSDATLLEQGEVLSDRYGIVTVPAVRVTRTGTRLALTSFAPAGVPPSGGGAIAVSGLPNPLRGACDFAVNLAAAGAARVTLHDVAGRRLREWSATPTAPRVWRLHLDADDLAAGVYLLRAAQGGASITRRVVVVR